MTEPTLLDENAISKIEARIAKRDDTSALESACGEYNCSCHYDLPALCATVKRLRAENERLLRGDFTDEELQGFCHNLSEQDQRAFFEGCTKYQQRLFGTSVAEQVREEIK